MNSTSYKTDIQIVLDENQLVTLCEMISDSVRYRRGLADREDMLEVSRIVRNALKEII